MLNSKHFENDTLPAARCGAITLTPNSHQSMRLIKDELTIY